MAKIKYTRADLGLTKDAILARDFNHTPDRFAVREPYSFAWQILSNGVLCPVYHVDVYTRQGTTMHVTRSYEIGDPVGRAVENMAPTHRPLARALNASVKVLYSQLLVVNSIGSELIRAVGRRKKA